MKDAVIRYYGSVKEAAFALGQVDPSLMMREFEMGKFARFDAHADVSAKAFTAEALHQQFGPSDPFMRAQQAITEARLRLDELSALIASSDIGLRRIG